ncbi:MAG: hypothetical protein JXN59_06735 [Anaerolineae bacterium]|nr:hypothetical protein [Anaerolineae bacterium]
MLTFTLLAAFLLLLTAACTGPPETQVYIVLTATHQPPTLTALAVETAEPGAAAATPEPETEESAEASAETQATARPVVVENTPAMPTPVITQIQVAEQVFQGGRMFWLQPTKDIWVMINDAGTNERGTWQIMEDTFEEGEAEIDPELTPPVDGIQPRRGFGKLWREYPEIREGLGWATTPEFGFVSNYEYRSGGYLDSEGRYIAGPGTHILVSLGKETFAFDEGDMTWRLLP